MDTLEYLAAMVDMCEKYWERPDGQPWVRPLNVMSSAVRAVGGELYADTDVHDTGECCCTTLD